MSKPYTEEEEMERFNAALKKLLNVTGPRVIARDLPGKRFAIDVDFNTIEKRGKDAGQ
jgi:hypothetical protein